jgi:hypothetical protein
MAVMDVHRRVSRVGDRDEKGDSYKSPELQREAIAQRAQRSDLQLGKVVRDEDVSGVKAVSSRCTRERSLVRNQPRPSPGSPYG